MSREISFKAWDKVNKKMYLPTEIECIFMFEGKSADIELINGVNIDDDDIELLQYTGLKDKNDVKIFEGDILEWFVKDKRCIGEVSCIIGCSTVKSVLNNHYVNTKDFRSCKVVGNIYENKELLK